MTGGLEGAAPGGPGQLPFCCSNDRGPGKGTVGSAETNSETPRRLLLNDALFPALTLCTLMATDLV